MAGSAARPGVETEITREELIEFLNEDLGREYQAIISYVVYSQVLKGAEYMNIAGELEKHAGRAQPRAHYFQTDRLSRRDADGSAQAGPDVQKSEGYAAIRS
jgi:hypothetical protein